MTSIQKNSLDRCFGHRHILLRNIEQEFFNMKDIDG